MSLAPCLRAPFRMRSNVQAMGNFNSKSIARRERTSAGPGRSRLSEQPAQTSANRSKATVQLGQSRERVCVLGRQFQAAIEALTRLRGEAKPHFANAQCIPDVIAIWRFLHRLTRPHLCLAEHLVM